MNIYLKHFLAILFLHIIEKTSLLDESLKTNILNLKMYHKDGNLKFGNLNQDFFSMSGGHIQAYGSSRGHLILRCLSRGRS